MRRRKSSAISLAISSAVLPLASIVRFARRYHGNRSSCSRRNSLLSPANGRGLLASPSALLAHRLRSSSTGTSRKIEHARASCSKRLFRTETNVPPPSAITVGCTHPARHSRSAACSICRNSASPSLRKISRIARPSRASIIASKSTNSHSNSAASARPTVVFPLPMKPVSATTCGRPPSPDCPTASLIAWPPKPRSPSIAPMPICSRRRSIYPLATIH